MSHGSLPENFVWPSTGVFASTLGLPHGEFPETLTVDNIHYEKRGAINYVDFSVVGLRANAATLSEHTIILGYVYEPITNQSDEPTEQHSKLRVLDDSLK